MIETPPRPLRNRVTPAGDLIATEHRGTRFGNRGVLHNDALTIVRRHQTRRWIVCLLQFRGRRRPLLEPRRYTGLFFLDDAVAFAAGHRPCAECRHDDYQQFRRAWATAHALPTPPTADAIDRVLADERRLRDGERITYREDWDCLPDGVFIRHDGSDWLRSEGALHRWTPAGYAETSDRFKGPADVLTPPSTVATLRAGYAPQISLGGR